MAQADYIRSKKNYRMEFTYGKKSFKFSLNPEEYTLDEGSRSLVTQTKAGAWVDDFGGALPTITIRGTTGHHSGGFKKFKELRNFIRSYYKNGSISGTVKDELYFYNYTDEEYFVVHTDPNGFRLSRSASKPLLYQYEINLTVLRHISDKKITVNFKAGRYDYGANNDSFIGSVADRTTYIQTTLGHTTNTTRSGTFDSTGLDQYVQTGKSVLPSSVAKSTSSANISGSKARGTIRSLGRLQTFASISEIEAQLDLSNFNPEISLLGVQTLKDIKNGLIKDDQRASKLPTDSFPYLYYKLCKNKNIETHIQERAKAVTLELMAIAVYPNSFHLSMSESDLERLVRNMHILINNLSEIKEYTLAQHFRSLQRCVIGLLGCNLYETDIATQISDLKNSYNPELE